ncbi:MAG: DNA (cytosine-5-)-methyltransferase, partial [Flavobacteriales bacterium]|nr:DNA (cytosine-5-)-methyltransferase [Flavobacteriales bacterium]
ISQIMDIDHEILKFSNMNRDIHIGHLLEKDKEGTAYCSLLALSKQENKEEIIQVIIKESLINHKNIEDTTSKISSLKSKLAS